MFCKNSLKKKNVRQEIQEELLFQVELRRFGYGFGGDALFNLMLHDQVVNHVKQHKPCNDLCFDKIVDKQIYPGKSLVSTIVNWNVKCHVYRRDGNH